MMTLDSKVTPITNGHLRTAVATVIKGLVLQLVIHGHCAVAVCSLAVFIDRIVVLAKPVADWIARS